MYLVLKGSPYSISYDFQPFLMTPIPQCNNKGFALLFYLAPCCSSCLVANVKQLKEWFEKRDYPEETVNRETKRALETSSLGCP